MKTLQTLSLLWMLLTMGACTTPTARQTQPLPEAEVASYRTCEKDADCVYVQNGCCDCANGGRDLAVHRDKATELRQRFDCSEAECTEMEAESPCDSGRVYCKDRLCQYDPPEGN